MLSSEFTKMSRIQSLNLRNVQSRDDFFLNEVEKSLFLESESFNTYFLQNFRQAI